MVFRITYSEGIDTLSETASWNKTPRIAFWSVRKPGGFLHNNLNMKGIHVTLQKEVNNVRGIRRNKLVRSSLYELLSGCRKEQKQVCLGCLEHHFWPCGVAGFDWCALFEQYLTRCLGQGIAGMALVVPS